MMRRTIGSALLLLALAAPTAGQAQSGLVLAYAECGWPAAAPPPGRAARDQMIAGCTAIIRSGQAGAQTLATAYNNRGVARFGEGDAAGARADFAEALRIAPGLGTARANRAAAEGGSFSSVRALPLDRPYAAPGAADARRPAIRAADRQG